MPISTAAILLLSVLALADGRITTTQTKVSQLASSGITELTVNSELQVYELKMPILYYVYREILYGIQMMMEIQFVLL